MRRRVLHARVLRGRLGLAAAAVATALVLVPMAGAADSVQTPDTSSGGGVALVLDASGNPVISYPSPAPTST